MNIARATLFGFILCTTLATLSDCGAATTPPVPLTPVLEKNPTHLVVPRHESSWIDADAKKGDLLYISDFVAQNVDVYSYPAGKRVGKLTAFNRPTGLCVDSGGNVFIAELTGFDIVEYAHGGTRPLRKLADPGEEPGDCSVDPLTGNLAVSNVSRPYSQPGNILIYRKARGTPIHYVDRDIDYYQFCGYDSAGNLYVDGNQSGNFRLAELPLGKRQIINIGVAPKIKFPGAVQWDGSTLAVGDYESNLIYRFRINGNVATEIGVTHLHHSSYAIGFWIEGSTVVGPNDDSANVMFWKYPAGGLQTKTISGLQNPWGATVSHAPPQ